MDRFTPTWRSVTAQSGRTTVAAALPDVVEGTIAIQQIPAPTFAEAARARYVRAQLLNLGLADVVMDEMHNVIGRVPGRARGPALLVTAHLDTVFAADVDLSVRREADRVWGPGIGDNSLGVAGLLALARVLHQQGPPRDVWVAANVGEEGLGNLRGMRRVLDELQGRLGAVVVLEGGAFGVVIHRGIGVERRRLTVETEGGHAWSDFGAPSAIHELCRIGAAIADVSLPETPRSSFNLGTIAGGTSVNTIASQATALLDLRSESPDTLRWLAGEVDRTLRARRRAGVTVRSDTIGERPAGGIPASHPLVQAALASLDLLNGEPPETNGSRLRAASTDANVPLARGLPAVCIGLTIGHNAHRLDEYIELPPLAAGLQHCYLTILAALEWLK